jgi:hypothetical protein
LGKKSCWMSIWYRLNCLYIAFSSNDWNVLF